MAINMKYHFFYYVPYKGSNYFFLTLHSTLHLLYISMAFTWEWHICVYLVLTLKKKNGKNIACKINEICIVSSLHLRPEELEAQK